MAEGLGLNAAGKREQQLKEEIWPSLQPSPGPETGSVCTPTTVQLPGCAGDWREVMTLPALISLVMCQQLGQSFILQAEKITGNLGFPAPGALCAMQASHRAEGFLAHNWNQILKRMIDLEKMKCTEAATEVLTL